MVSGLAPYVPDLPLSAGPGKKQNQATIKLFACSNSKITITSTTATTNYQANLSTHLIPLQPFTTAVGILILQAQGT